MLILGIDPGLEGALAFYETEGQHFTIVPTPIFKTKKPSGKGHHRRIDLVSVANLLDQHSIVEPVHHAFIEKVGASPQMGVVSAFNFGYGYGALVGLLAAHFIPTTEVLPAAWKKALRCPADKTASRARASQLLPKWATHWPLVKDDGKAEAAMLAYYGAHYG